MESIGSTPSKESTFEAVFFNESPVSNVIVFIEITPHKWRIYQELCSVHSAKVKFIIKKSNTEFISGGYDKQIHLLELDSQTHQFAVRQTWKAQKKVTHAIYDSEASKLFFCDKHGDVYSINLLDKDQSVPPFLFFANMATYTHVQLLANKKELLLCDNYFRLKLCHFPNIYDLISIMQPRRSKILSALEDTERNGMILHMDDPNQQALFLPREALTTSENREVKDVKTPSGLTIKKLDQITVKGDFLVVTDESELRLAHLDATNHLICRPMHDRLLLLSAAKAKPKKIKLNAGSQEFALFKFDGDLSEDIIKVFDIRAKDGLCIVRKRELFA
jgi:hypothetical protein